MRTRVPPRRSPPSRLKGHYGSKVSGFETLDIFAVGIETAACQRPAEAATRIDCGAVQPDLYAAMIGFKSAYDLAIAGIGRIHIGKIFAVPPERVALGIERSCFIDPGMDEEQRPVVGKRRPPQPRAAAAPSRSAARRKPWSRSADSAALPAP